MAQAAPGKRETKKRALRQAIYETAVSLFERHGYDTVSVGQITQAVGIGKGTFFNHFETKADILADWYEREVKDALPTPDPGAPLLDRLHTLVYAAVALFRDQPELLRAKNAESPRSERLQAAERAIDLRLLRALEAELARESLPATAPSPERLADLVLTIATGTWREAAVTGQPSEPGDRLRQRLEVLLSTIQT